jgi:hypothetical protein
MQKSFKSRLEALERLETERSGNDDRVLCVWLHIRPDEYVALLGDDDAGLRVWYDYGLDQIGDGERVNVWGATWPDARMPQSAVMLRRPDAEGYGCWCAEWPLYADAPAPGEWRWVVSVDGDTAQVLRRQRDTHAAW